MSAEAIELAIDELNNVMSGLVDLKRMYADPPESISEFPCGMTYIGEGVYNAGSDTYGMHTLILDIYEGRQVLPQAVDNAKRWPDRVRALLNANSRLNDTVDHVGNREFFIRYRAQPMEYNANIHYGVRFWIPVKVRY